MNEKDNPHSPSMTKEEILKESASDFSKLFDILKSRCHSLLAKMIENRSDEITLNMMTDLKRDIETGISLTNKLLKINGPLKNDLELTEVFQQKVTPEISTFSKDPNNSKTILLAEDEDNLRNILRELLEENGFIVLTAKDVYEVLSIYNQQKNNIDLILTDVIMPEMSGPELSRQIQNIRKGVKVIYMSGFTGSLLENEKEKMGDDGWDFIQKPFTTNALLEKIKKICA